MVYDLDHLIITDDYYYVEQLNEAISITCASPCHGNDNYFIVYSSCEPGSQEVASLGQGEAIC
jgi:hypothetical protein